MINNLHVTAYERDLKIRNRSPRTAQNYRETLLQLSQWVKGADLLELSRASVEGYILHVLETRSAASASGRYRALRAFYNWAVREELIPASPMAKMIPPKVVEKPIPVVGDDLLKRLFGPHTARAAPVAQVGRVVDFGARVGLIASGVGGRAGVKGSDGVLVVRRVLAHLMSAPCRAA